MSAANDLLKNYQHVIDQLDLVTGAAGIFDVAVNDELIYSKEQTNRHANAGEVLDLFTELVGPDVPRYGT